MSRCWHVSHQHVGSGNNWKARHSLNSRSHSWYSHLWNPVVLLLTESLCHTPVWGMCQELKVAEMVGAELLPQQGNWPVLRSLCCCTDFKMSFLNAMLHYNSSKCSAEENCLKAVVSLFQWRSAVFVHWIDYCILRSDNPAVTETFQTNLPCFFSKLCTFYFASYTLK